MATMCGRYNITDSPYVQALMAKLGMDTPLPAQYNIAPTEQVPVIYQHDQTLALMSARWWLVPGWSDGPNSRYAMFNARSETLSKSPAFRGPFRRQRCLMPASSFIEWHTHGGTKQPYEISPVEDAFAFAGLWDCWQSDGQTIYSCTMITTEAVPGFSHIHKRMPVGLIEAEWPLWLNPNSQPQALAPLLTPSLRQPWQITPVDTAIGNSRNKLAPQATGSTQIIAS